MLSRWKDVILSFTKCPSGTVITHVHFMFGGQVCGYKGEKRFPALPVRGITLSTPWSLHGPMAAGKKKKKKRRQSLTNAQIQPFFTQNPDSNVAFPVHALQNKIEFLARTNCLPKRSTEIFDPIAQLLTIHHDRSRKFSCQLSFKIHVIVHL